MEIALGWHVCGGTEVNAAYLLLQYLFLVVSSDGSCSRVSKLPGQPLLE